MKALFKFEFAKLYHRKITWLMIIMSIVLSVIAAFTIPWYKNKHEITILMSYTIYMKYILTTIIFISIIYFNLTLVEEMQRKTAKIVAYQQIKVGKWLMAKWFNITVFCLILASLSIISLVVGIYLFSGYVLFDEQSFANNLAVEIITLIVRLLFYGGLTMLLTNIFVLSRLAVLISICWLIFNQKIIHYLELLINNNFTNYTKHLPTSILKFMQQDNNLAMQQLVQFTLQALIILLIALILIIISQTIFKKRVARIK